MKKGLLGALISGLLILGLADVAPMLTQYARAQTEAPITPINLNTATDEELLTVPNLGNRMLREFKEYRPYSSVEEFRREIGKYVESDVVEGYLRYVFVPTNPNTATDSELAALPGVDEAMVQTMIDNRDYADWAALSTVLAQSYEAAIVASLEPLWIFE